MTYSQYAAKHKIPPANFHTSPALYEYIPPEEIPSSELDYLIREGPIERYNTSPQRIASITNSKSYYDGGTVEELKQIKYLFIGLLVLLFLVVLILLFKKS